MLQLLRRFFRAGNAREPHSFPPVRVRDEFLQIPFSLACHCLIKMQTQILYTARYVFLFVFVFVLCFC